MVHLTILRIVLWVSGYRLLKAAQPFTPKVDNPCHAVDESEQCTSLIQSAKRTKKAAFAEFDSNQRDGEKVAGLSEEDLEEDLPGNGAVTPQVSQGSPGSLLAHGVGSEATLDDDVDPQAKGVTAEAFAKAGFVMKNMKQASGQEPIVRDWHPLAMLETAGATHQPAAMPLHKVWTGAGGWLTDRAVQMFIQSRNTLQTTSAGVYVFITAIVVTILACVCYVVPSLSGNRLDRDTAGGDRYQDRLRMKLPVNVPSLSNLSTNSRPRASHQRDPPQPAPPRSPRLESTRDSTIDSFLCPGLVVPSGCECTLLVPRLSPQYQPNMLRAGQNQVTIDDVKGVPVFRASYSLPVVGPSTRASTTRSNASGNKCLLLTSTTQDATVFAFCRDSRAELGFEPGALAIHTASGRPFGSLRPCRDKGAGQGFEVVTSAGFWVHISTSDAGLLTAIDRQGRSLAAGERSSESASLRTVRIGPLVDAGLLTLAILACDLMETALAEQAQTPAPSMRETAAEGRQTEGRPLFN